MIRFILIRLATTIPVLLIILTATFFMIRQAPGGPFTAEKKASPEVIANMNAFYGLDKKLSEQYFSYVKNVVLHGDLGPSWKSPNRSVNELIASALPASIELGLYALCISISFGMIAGVVASLRPNTAIDYVPMSLTMIGICIPTFVLGPLLVRFFGIKLGWLSVSGWFFPEDRILPALTLGCYYTAYIARLTRGGMLEILNQDYIRTAFAKGASGSRTIFRHALRGGMLPTISFLGPAVAGLLTGSFVVESIFQVPGLGRYFVMSAFNRDYTMVCGTVLFYATLIILLNLLVDVVLVWLNPKLRFN